MIWQKYFVKDRDVGDCHRAPWNFSSPRPADTVYCPKNDMRQIHI
eukprot:SAG11_NODE_21977_length_414_cov_3.012698_1_plen_44_part_01